MSRVTKELSSYRSCNIRADWLEDDDSHSFIIDLPGITGKDVKLEIIDGVTLEISGQFPPETHCNLKWHVKERPTGAFRRTFLLPQNVLASKLRAFEVDGMLVVKIPKKKS
ncbi:hypothetical protein KP509_36G011400 [Ceratopteris richardii]|uniref:SHSP domain-containing protein n=1 Tax=Ceratopteris richardii TaxID=49495 RepID=A0A8T2QAS5_CERRI|nr:hypothetical protein KP509_36G011400 [Ceratopteris richardii]